MLRLKTNKTKLYKLVREYDLLPPMSRTTFTKTHGRPEYWMRWSNDFGLRCDAFLAAVGGKPKLVITKTEPGGPEVSRVVYTMDIKDLMGRGMVEEFIPAAERCGEERVADHELV